jgi:flagellar biogenesis protein FliO
MVRSFLPDQPRHQTLSRDTRTDAMATTPEQRKANARLALILASVALVFALGFVAKIAWLSPSSP